MSEKDGELELTPGYRISIPLTHVDGPEERELLRRRHPPHPDIPRNLIAQGWFESGYDTAALEFWDVVHEANRELAARDAEISSLRDQLRRVEGERDEAQRQCGELHEHLALMVRYLEEEASEGDGIAEQHWDGYQGAKSVLVRTAPNEAAWETAMVEFAQLQERASHVPGLSAALDEDRSRLRDLAQRLRDVAPGTNDGPLNAEDYAERIIAELTSLRSLLPDVRLIAESDMYDANELVRDAQVSLDSGDVAGALECLRLALGPAERVPWRIRGAVEYLERLQQEGT